MDFTTLNQEQHAAVTRHEGPMMILAGAGTGKTRVISYRIGHMLSVGGIRADRMVALTFTNKAAREMKERIFHLAGSMAKGIFVGTFHSFCIAILRRHAAEAGLHTRFKLIGTAEQIDLIRRAVDELKWGQLYKPEMLLARISNAKNALLVPDDLRAGKLPSDFTDEDPTVLAEVYAMYERQLKLNRVIDFDDCILRVVKTLEGVPAVLSSLQDRHTHFMVDEFQDTNRAQLRVVELLAARSRNICVVGDDDQSIYSWRGAMVETLDRFEEAFPGTVMVKLEQNYRCSNVILNAANTVIKNNTGRKGKTLWSKSTIETPIVLATLDDDQEEAKWIAKRCFGLLGQGYKPKDIGILYRANAQARALETALREYQLKYKVFGGSSFFERKEVKDFLSYFKLALDPDDRLSFWRVINTPSRGVGIKTLERIEQKSLETHASPFQVLKDKQVPLNGPVEAAVDEFIGHLEELRRQGPVNPDDVEAMGKEIIRRFGLEDDIRLKTAHEGARVRKMESLRRLPAWLKQLTQNQFDEKESLDIHGLLDHLTLSDEDAGDKDKGDGNHISLMTIHAAKGLEFPCVFVCGIEEEQLPHKNSLESHVGLSEERRLFYVALTRAKEQLFLSLARERFSGFQRLLRKPSRFIQELPADGVVQETANPALAFETADQRKTQNVARLQSLRDSLKKGFDFRGGA